MNANLYALVLLFVGFMLGFSIRGFPDEWHKTIQSWRKLFGKDAPR